MKLSHLIDTDWIIHYLNGNKGITEKIRSLEVSGLADFTMTIERHNIMV